MDPDQLIVPEPEPTDENEIVNEKEVLELKDNKDIREETMDSTETFYNSELNDLLD